MDGLKAFNQLCESIPEWTERLKALSFAVNERHLEFTRLSRTTSGAASLHRRRTGSTESLRPDDEASPTHEMKPDADGAPSSPARIEINPASKRLFQEYRQQAKRKRASGSCTSNNSDAPRSRMSMIVYYDSAIQESFEVMVRSIAGARNTLRKGKAAASMKDRMASIAVGEDPFENNGIDGAARSPKVPRLTSPEGSGRAYSATSFEKIDKELESAQTLCEIGAHQFLRDGNCQIEIAGASERIESIALMAQEQRASYEHEAKAEDERNAKEANVSSVLYIRKTTESGLAAENSTTNDLLAIDESYTRSSMPGMDSAIAIDPAIAIDSVVVDPAIATNHNLPVPSHADGDAGTTVDSITVSPSFGAETNPAHDSSAVDSGVSMGPKGTEDTGLSLHSKTKSGDHTGFAGNFAVDSGSQGLEGGLEIDPESTYHNDSRDKAFDFGLGPIEVDDTDAESFHVDLTSFRRTRAM